MAAWSNGMVDLITSENVSKELLKEILDSAFLDTSWDKDGDLMVKEQVNCFVLPNMERKDRIRLLALFGFKPEVSESERMRAVNAINSQYIVVRASVLDNGALAFDYDLLLDGGITARALVLALKRFCSIPIPAIGDCATGLVS